MKKSKLVPLGSSKCGIDGWTGSVILRAYDVECHIHQASWTTGLVRTYRRLQLRLYRIPSEQEAISKMRLILPPGASEADVQTALDALPPGRLAVMNAQATEPMFPPKGYIGRCRICGRTETLTEEHLPPRAALNKSTFRTASFDQWIKSVDLEIEPNGPHTQGGVRGHMLCRKCNSLTGHRWGAEYKKWAFILASAMSGLPKSLAEIADIAGYPGIGRVEFRDIYPGRFVRQALSMMMCISGSADLGDRHPVIRDLVLGGNPAPLPSGMKLFMAPCAGPRARFHGGPFGQYNYNIQTNIWTFTLEAALPPIGIQLVLEGEPSRCFGVDISEYTEQSVDLMESLKVDDLPLGFTYSPYQCDYRTAGEMRANLNQTG